MALVKKAKNLNDEKEIKRMVDKEIEGSKKWSI